MKKITLLSIVSYPIVVFSAIVIGVVVSNYFANNQLGKIIIALAFFVAPMLSGAITPDKAVRNSVIGSLVFTILLIVLALVALTKAPSGLATSFFAIVLFPVYAVIAALLGYVGGKLNKKK